MATSYQLGTFEEQILLVVRELKDDAYGMTIRQAMDQATGRSVAIGAVYTTLDRLEEKGLVKSWVGAPTEERGNRPRKFFEIEGAGVKALEEAEAIRRRITGLRGLQFVGG